MAKISIAGIMGRKNASKTRSDVSEESKSRNRAGMVLHAVVGDLRYGRTVSAGFFRKNAWLLVAFLAAVLSLMGLRYKTKQRMAEIKQLTVELQRAESSMLQEKAAYMSLIRETEMRRLVRERGLGLDFRDQPPYVLEYEQ